MIEISLWGNATDLSLLATLKFEGMERLQGKKAIEAQQKNIVVNDMNEVWKYVKTLKDAQIDIVLDNAGIPVSHFPNSRFRIIRRCIPRSLLSRNRSSKDNRLSPQEFRLVRI
jgi:Damage-control phosphatase ARMT1-like domain